MITTINEFKEQNNFNQREYLKWKRANVSYRGMAVVGQKNGGSAVLGNGLYTAALSNKSMARGYGDVYFVVNAIPKNPKVFNNFNEWEIWFYEKLVSQYTTDQQYPRQKDFYDKTTIEAEMQKMGYDGIVIKGREYVIYKPENIKYFKTEDELKNYYSYNISESKEYDNLSDNVILNKETLEPIDSDIYEIDHVIDIITDQEEIKKFEARSASYDKLNTTDLTYKTVDRNDIIWITCMLKPRNNSGAYPLGEMGVIQCKVLQTFYGLNKLKQLKQSDKII